MRNGDDGRSPPPPPSDGPGGLSDLFSSSDLPDSGAQAPGTDSGVPEGSTRIMTADDRERALAGLDIEDPSRRDTGEIDGSAFADNTFTSRQTQNLSTQSEPAGGFQLPSIDFSLPPGVGDGSGTPRAAAGGAELPAHLQLPSFPDFDLPPVPGESNRLLGDVGIESNLGGSFGAMNDTSAVKPTPTPTTAPGGFDPNDGWAVTPPGQMPPPPPKRPAAKAQHSGPPPGLADLPSLPQMALPSVAKQQTKKEPTLLRAEKAEEIAKIQKKSVVGPILIVAVLVAGAGSATFMYRDLIIDKLFPAKQTQAEETATDKARKLVAAGQSQFDSNNYPAAIDMFEQALKVDPSYAKAHRSLGIAYASSKQPEKAVDHYRLYLAMEPAAADAGEVKKIVDDWDSKAKERASEAQKKAEEQAKAQAEQDKAKKKGRSH